MNANLLLLLDGDNHLEWWPVASAALAAVLAGVILAYLNRRSRHQDQLETNEKAAIQAGINNLSDGLETERRERQQKDDALGDDIQDTRGALDHLCGTLKEPRPTYRSKK